MKLCEYGLLYEYEQLLMCRAMSLMMTKGMMILWMTVMMGQFTEYTCSIVGLSVLLCQLDSSVCLKTTHALLQCPLVCKYVY